MSLDKGSSQHRNLRKNNSNKMSKDRNKYQKISTAHNILKIDIKNSNKTINSNNKINTIIDKIKVLRIEIIRVDLKNPWIRILTKIKDFKKKK